MQNIKRYLVGLFFLMLVVILMLIGTYGVEKFGENLTKDTGIVMKPRGGQLQ